MISRPVVMTVLFGAAGLAVAAVTSRHALIEALAPPWAEPIRVSGLVTSGGQPVNGILITLALADERRIGAEATTDASGRFTATVDGPGLYVALVSAHKALSSTSREITIQRGHNYLGIDLPPTEVRVTIMGTGPGESSLVQVALHGPADGLGDSRGGFLTGSDGLVARFVGIGYGDYRVSAFTNDERPLTSAAPALFRISPATPVVDISLGLVQRALTLVPVDEHGEIVEGATATALHRRLPQHASAKGLDASGVPAGEPMVVSAPGRLSVCRYAATGEAQRVELPALGSAKAVIRLLDSIGRPAGVLLDVPASDCPLPIASLEVEWTRVAETPGRVDMVIKGLPSGAYGFRVTERAPVRTVRTSGETLIYRVPPSCRLCG